MAILDLSAMEDLRVAVAVARLSPKMEPREVQRFLLKNPRSVLKHAPRVIPPPEILMKRYDEVINLYRSIPDIVTGERFYDFLIEIVAGVTCLIAFVFLLLYFSQVTFFSWGFIFFVCTLFGLACDHGNSFFHRLLVRKRNIFL